MKISKHCYVISGLSVEPPWSVNSGFIVGEHTTLIVDTGSNYLSAQTIYGYASCVKPNNKIIVVNTEPHYDHMGGNSFFRDKSIDVFAHPSAKRNEEEFRQNIEDFNNTIPNEIRRKKREAEIFFYKTDLVNPNKYLSQDEIIDLGDIAVVVHETPGHTPSNISLFVSKDRVLYCGDCVVTGYIPHLEDGNIADWEIWLQSIEAVKKLMPEIVVTGHGYSIVGQVNVENELFNIRSILNKAIKDSIAPTQQHIV